MKRGWRGLHKEELRNLQFSLYGVAQEERSVVWEVTVSAKKCISTR
jgi:hypothetical protein